MSLKKEYVYVSNELEVMFIEGIWSERINVKKMITLTTAKVALHGAGWSRFILRRSRRCSFGYSDNQ